MIRHRTILLSLAVFAVALSFVLPMSVSAITVGPVKLEYSLDPGATVSGKMYIKNEELSTKTFYPSVERFTEQNGEKQFIKNDSLIADWLKVGPSVTLAAGKDTEVPFSLVIPKDAPPGGQFAVVWWSTSAPIDNNTQQVSIQSRAGILVYVNISGKVVENTTITKFDTASGGHIFGDNVVPFYLNISNAGNVYVKPVGKITISNIFGSVKDAVTVNEKKYQILPNSYRVYSDMIWNGHGFYIGPYKVLAAVSYNDKTSTVLYSSFWIWIFPWKIILIAVVSIVAVLVLLFLFFRFYNNWLIKKYTKGDKKSL
jgi:hypothetical protein